MGQTIEQMINRTGEKWFLDDMIKWWDIGKDPDGTPYLDLSLTDYKIDRVYNEKARQKFSKLRYISITDCLIKPGFGKGYITINDRDFKITYAWAGLNSKRHYHRRLSYTVRVTPIGNFKLSTFVSNLIKLIYFDENIKDFKRGIKRVNTYTFEESTYLKKEYMKD